MLTTGLYSVIPLSITIPTPTSTLVLEQDEQIFLTEVGPTITFQRLVDNTTYTVPASALRYLIERI